MSADALNPSARALPASFRVRSLPGGTVTVALGAFLLTLALLLPVYVHDRIALLPADTQFDVQMADDEAAYLNTSTWTWIDEAEIERSLQVDASGHSDGWSAWEMSVDTVVGETVVDHWSRRAIVHRETGRAVNCCGEHVNGDRAVRQAGLVYYWPPGGQEDSYPYYDAETRSAPVLEFQEWDQVAGLTVRRYGQQVEATQVPDSAREVPADVFTSGAQGTVTATRWLEVSRVFWVEPHTGMVVNAEESRSETLRSENGGGETALLEAELAVADQQVAGFAEQARVRSLLLRGLDSWAPWVLGPLGALTVAAGLVRAWRARGSAAEGPRSGIGVQSETAEQRDEGDGNAGHDAPDRSEGDEGADPESETQELGNDASEDGRAPEEGPVRP